MIDEGRITQSTANFLIQSVDEAIDLITDEPLGDWNILKAHVHFPRYYRFLQMNFFASKLVTHFTMERLASACYICAAFLHAHKKARRQLHEFFGENEMASLVINESDVQGEDAGKFLEDVHLTFPEVLDVMKTRRGSYSLVNYLSKYLQNLEKTGLLEKNEKLLLDESLQDDLKKLHRKPPLVKMEKLGEMLSIHPLLAALPSVLHNPVESSTEKIVKLSKITLYKEGMKTNGIWLISRGVVKCSAKNLRNRQSLHPTFSHGSTLGLYELLIGEPYICDTVTDTMVLCFFIKAEKMLSILRSYTLAEEIIWKESAITVAKILLPQKFEKMELQEIRDLITERSTMEMYGRGEIILMHQNVIGLLLVGSVKTQDAQQVLFRSPAALLPFHENLGVDSYQVETSARVILFEMDHLP